MDNVQKLNNYKFIRGYISKRGYIYSLVNDTGSNSTLFYSAEW
jgi:hypothetical protein